MMSRDGTIKCGASVTDIFPSSIFPLTNIQSISGSHQFHPLDYLWSAFGLQSFSQCNVTLVSIPFRHPSGRGGGYQGAVASVAALTALTITVTSTIEPPPISLAPKPKLPMSSIPQTSAFPTTSQTAPLAQAGPTLTSSVTIAAHVSSILTYHSPTGKAGEGGEEDGRRSNPSSLVTPSPIAAQESAHSTLGLEYC